MLPANKLEVFGAVGENAVRSTGYAAKRVRRERHLPQRGENPDPIIRIRIIRRQNEGRLREIRPGSKRLHLSRIQAVRVEHDGKPVSARRHACKDITLDEAPLHR